MSDNPANPAPSQEPTPQGSSNNELPPSNVTPPNDSGVTPQADPATPPVGDTPPADPATPPVDPDLTGADWREKYAGDDEKKLNVLKRYGSQKAMMDALFAARGKIKDNESHDLPENATDEQKAKYRESKGIPNEAGDYAKNLPEGMEISEDDMGQWQPLFEKMHDKNVPQDVMNEVAQAYAEAGEIQRQARLDLDQEQSNQVDEELREEWGADYAGNKNMIKNAVALMFPEEFHQQIYDARLADGTPLFASKEGAMAFAEVARKFAPHGTTVTSEGVSDIGTIESNLKELQGRMGTTSWYSDTASQKKYQDYCEAYKRNTGKEWTGS